MPALGPMTGLDRLSAQRDQTALLAELLAAPQTEIIALVGTRAVIRSNAQRTAATLARFSCRTCPGGAPTLNELLFLGVRPGTQDAVFARNYSQQEAENVDPGGVHLAPAVDLRSLAQQGVLSPDDLAVAATAAALSAWHEGARFCGHCASSTTSRNGGWTRHCPACDRSLFPRTDPVVIMLVTAGDECVLARQAAFPENMWSSLAGFLEPGETIEAAVTRETLEEIGIPARDVTYLASQPWPFPHSLMIGCLATADRTPLRVDPTELEMARWFTRAEVRQMLSGDHPRGLWVPGPHAIARTLVSHFAFGADDLR